MHYWHKAILLVIIMGIMASYAGPVLALKLELLYPKVPGVLTPNEIEQKIEQKFIEPQQRFGLYIKYFLRLFFILITTVAAASIVFGGVLYLLSGAKPGLKANAIGWMRSGFLGLTIVVTSFLVLSVINPQLIVFPTIIPKVPKTASLPPSPTPKTAVYKSVSPTKVILDTIEKAEETTSLVEKINEYDCVPRPKDKENCPINSAPQKKLKIGNSCCKDLCIPLIKETCAAETGQKCIALPQGQKKCPPQYSKKINNKCCNNDYIQETHHTEDGEEIKVCCEVLKRTDPMPLVAVPFWQASSTSAQLLEKTQRLQELFARCHCGLATCQAKTGDVNISGVRAQCVTPEAGGNDSKPPACNFAECEDVAGEEPTIDQIKKTTNEIQELVSKLQAQGKSVAAVKESPLLQKSLALKRTAFMIDNSEGALFQEDFAARERKYKQSGNVEIKVEEGPGSTISYRKVNTSLAKAPEYSMDWWGKIKTKFRAWFGAKASEPEQQTIMKKDETNFYYPVYDPALPEIMSVKNKRREEEASRMNYFSVITNVPPEAIEEQMQECIAQAFGKVNFETNLDSKEAAQAISQALMEKGEQMTPELAKAIIKDIIGKGITGKIGERIEEQGSCKFLCSADGAKAPGPNKPTPQQVFCKRVCPQDDNACFNSCTAGLDISARPNNCITECCKRVCPQIDKKCQKNCVKSGGEYTPRPGPNFLSTTFTKLLQEPLEKNLPHQVEAVLHSSMQEVFLKQKDLNILHGSVLDLAEKNDKLSGVLNTNVRDIHPIVNQILQKRVVPEVITTYIEELDDLCGKYLDKMDALIYSTIQTQIEDAAKVVSYAAEKGIQDLKNKILNPGLAGQGQIDALENSQAYKTWEEDLLKDCIEQEKAAGTGDPEGVCRDRLNIKEEDKSLGKMAKEELQKAAGGMLDYTGKLTAALVDVGTYTMTQYLMKWVEDKFLSPLQPYLRTMQQFRKKLKGLTELTIEDALGKTVKKKVLDQNVKGLITSACEAEKYFSNCKIGCNNCAYDCLAKDSLPNKECNDEYSTLKPMPGPEPDLCCKPNPCIQKCKKWCRTTYKDECHRECHTSFNNAKDKEKCLKECDTTKIQECRQACEKDPTKAASKCNSYCETGDAVTCQADKWLNEDIYDKLPETVKVNLERTMIELLPKEIQEKLSQTPAQILFPKVKNLNKIINANAKQAICGEINTSKPTFKERCKKLLDPVTGELDLTEPRLSQECPNYPDRCKALCPGIIMLCVVPPLEQFPFLRANLAQQLTSYLNEKCVALENPSACGPNCQNCPSPDHNWCEICSYRDKQLAFTTLYWTVRGLDETGIIKTDKQEVAFYVITKLLFFNPKKPGHSEMSAVVSAVAQKRKQDGVFDQDPTEDRMGDIDRVFNVLTVPLNPNENILSQGTWNKLMAVCSKDGLCSQYQPNIEAMYEGIKGNVLTQTLRNFVTKYSFGIIEQIHPKFESGTVKWDPKQDKNFLAYSPLDLFNLYCTKIKNDDDANADLKNACKHFQENINKSPAEILGLTKHLMDYIAPEYQLLFNLIDTQIPKEHLWPFMQRLLYILNEWTPLTTIKKSADAFDDLAEHVKNSTLEEVKGYMIENNIVKKLTIPEPLPHAGTTITLPDDLTTYYNENTKGQLASALKEEAQALRELYKFLTTKLSAYLPKELNTKILDLLVCNKMKQGECDKTLGALIQKNWQQGNLSWVNLPWWDVLQCNPLQMLKNQCPGAQTKYLGMSIYDILNEFLNQDEQKQLNQALQMTFAEHLANGFPVLRQPLIDLLGRWLGWDKKVYNAFQLKEKADQVVDNSLIAAQRKMQEATDEILVQKPLEAGTFLANAALSPFGKKLSNTTSKQLFQESCVSPTEPKNGQCLTDPNQPAETLMKIGGRGFCCPEGNVLIEKGNQYQCCSYGESLVCEPKGNKPCDTGIVKQDQCCRTLMDCIADKIYSVLEPSMLYLQSHNINPEPFEWNIK